MLELKQSATDKVIPFLLIFASDSVTAVRVFTLDDPTNPTTRV
jgi:hypothetical protein